MSALTRIATGTPWESRYGYSRAVRAGNLVFFTGTVAMLDGKVAFPGDAYRQTLRCYEIIEQALREFAADRTAIVRSRMFVTDIVRNHDDHGRAHKEFFNDHRPCLTMLGGIALIDPAMLVEVEVDAVLPAL